MKIISTEKKTAGDTQYNELRVFGKRVYHYARVGDMSIANLFGFDVFKQAGDAKQLLGVTYGCHS